MGKQSYYSSKMWMHWSIRKETQTIFRSKLEIGIIEKKINDRTGTKINYQSIVISLNQDAKKKSAWWFRKGIKKIK